tara:strand:- start:41331 stop:41801 length:471 start_codon:yes stop_codon:yes gene_type:complete
MSNTTETVSAAEAFIAQILETTDITTLIDCENLNPEKFEPGSPAHGAVYEQTSRFKDAVAAAQMTDKQRLMFTARFIRSMRELVKLQFNSEALGLDAHVRAGQATILFIREDGQWFTKLIESNNINCTGAYLAACSKKANAWTFLLFREDGDIHRN